MRERLYRVQAIILKRTDAGEADRLLTVLTPDLGKLRVNAKGARKPASRKSGYVELFSHVEFLLARGHQVDVVTQVDTRDAFSPLRENLERMGYAYYFAELMDRFAEEGTENHALFELLRTALGWLGETDAPILLARFFELRLLHHVGYRPQLFECVNCAKPVEPIENYFSVEAGGVLDPECTLNRREQIAGHARDAEPISLTALKILRYLQTREWETVRGLKLRANELAEVETILLRYITHHLERQLKSVEFLWELKSLRS